MEPLLARFPPCLVATEMHTPLTHGVAWLVLRPPWLLHEMMQVHAVDAGAKGLVSNRLEPCRMFIPSSQVRSRSEGLGPNDALIEFMRARDDGIVSNWTPFVFAAPEFHVWMIEKLHDLVDLPGARVRLGHELQSSFMSESPRRGPIAVAIEILDCALEVGVELIGSSLAAEGASGKDWEPGKNIVTAAVLELLGHLRRPGWLARFIAVEVERAENRAGKIAKMLFDLSQHMLQMEDHCFSVHFVAFQANRIPLGGLNHRAGRRMTKAKDGPFTFRCIPCQFPVGIHLCG